MGQHSKCGQQDGEYRGAGKDPGTMNEHNVGFIWLRGWLALAKAHLKELNSPVVNDSCALKCISDQITLGPFLQVTEETSTVLRKLGYSCDCRGFINVKGKGELKTFFVCTDASKQQSMGLSWGRLRRELRDSCALTLPTVAVEPRWTRFITSAEWRRLLLPIPSLCVYDLHWSLLSSLVFEGEFTTLVSDPVGFKTPPERVKLCLEPDSKCVSVPSWEGMDTQLWAARNELYRRSGTDLLHFWCIHVRKLFKLHCLTMLQNMNLLYFKLLFS